MSGRWELVFLLWGAFFLNQADRQVFNVVLPLMRDDLGLTDQAMGLIATGFTIVYGLLVPVAGFMGDILDRRSVVFGSLLVFSVGTLLTGFASSFLLLLLFRSLATGAGEAFYAPAASSLIGSAHPAQTRTRALSLHQTANYTGVVLGSLITGWIAQAFSWRAAFLAYGVFGIAWAGLFLWRSRRWTALAPAPRPAGRGHQLALAGEAVRVIWRTPVLMSQMLAFGGLIFALVGFLTWSPTLLFETYGLPLAEAGFTAVLYHHLLAYGGVLLAGLAADRWFSHKPGGRIVMMALGLIAGGASIAWAARADTLFQFYVGIAAFGLFRGLYDSGIFAGVFDYVEDRLRATVTGVLLASGFLIGAVSPLLMGMLKAEHGLLDGMNLLAVVIAAAGLQLLVVALLQGRVRRGHAAAER